MIVVPLFGTALPALSRFILVVKFTWSPVVLEVSELLEVTPDMDEIVLLKEEKEDGLVEEEEVEEVEEVEEDNASLPVSSGTATTSTSVANACSNVKSGVASDSASGTVLLVAVDFDINK